MARSPRAFFAVVVLAVTMLGRLAVGDPILPKTPKPNDSIISLTGVKQVEILVNRLPNELRAAGLTEEDIKARWTKRLTDEHFVVAEGKGYPKLELRTIATVDPDVPNAVAYAFVIGFLQPVRIERLDQTLFLVTYSDTLMGQETTAHLGHAAIVNAGNAVDLFISMVKKANENKGE